MWGGGKRPTEAAYSVANTRTNRACDETHFWFWVFQKVTLSSRILVGLPRLPLLGAGATVAGGGIEGAAAGVNVWAG